MVKFFSYKNEQLAIVVEKDYSSEGTKFFTDENSPQQIGYMKHNKGHKISAHTHNEIERQISLTQETLVIRKGKLRLDLYSKEKEYIESTILNEGDIAILVSGGHGFCCLEDTEIVEIKQGPYLGIKDKVLIKEVQNNEVKLDE